MLIRKQIFIDQILCIYERYRSKDYSYEVFERLWGESPSALKVRKGPWCMRNLDHGIEDPDPYVYGMEDVETTMKFDDLDGFNEMTQRELDDIND